MDNLNQTVETLRAKIDDLRHRSLKETSTRQIIIDPILEALGWNIQNPDEVDLEFPTVDGKSADYALKVEGKPVLFVEAKALDDRLEDIKAVTQVVDYATNNGTRWCALTNGLRWRVYCSLEQCPAPDKLVYEASIDPRETDSEALGEVLRQLRLISREEMVKGTLVETFTDVKVRKAIESLMRNPPRPLLNMVRRAVGDASPNRVGRGNYLPPPPTPPYVRFRIRRFMPST